MRQGARLRAAGCGDARLRQHRGRGGRASLRLRRTAIKAALAGEVDAVVAAPQNETSIARAGITFDGYPSFVARETGTDEDGVYLMLCFGDTKIVHATLHRSVRDAIALITRENVIGVDRARRTRAQAARHRRRPKIAVGGLNPHAGEGGLFGREEIEIIKPAIDDAVRREASQSPARSAPTPCFTCRASTPSSSCCTTRATSPRSCWRRTPPRR